METKIESMDIKTPPNKGANVHELLDALAPFAKAFEPIAAPNTLRNQTLQNYTDENIITPTVKMGDFRKAYEIYKKCI